MTSPKHLWSGDWERESAASRAAHDRAQDASQPPPSSPSPSPQEPPRWRPRRGVLAIAALAAVAIVAAALAIGLSGGRRQPTVTISGQTTVPTGPTATATVPNVVPPFGQTGTTPTAPVPTPTTPGGTTTAPGGTATAPGGTATAPGSTGTTPTGTTGTTTAPGTGTLGLVLQSLPDNRVSVQAVVPGSPAEQAGIGAGDVLLSVNGHRVSSPSQVYSILHGLAKGTAVTMRLIQGATSLTARIQASGYP